MSGLISIVGGDSCLQAAFCKLTTFTFSSLFLLPLYSMFVMQDLGFKERVRNGRYLGASCQCRKMKRRLSGA